MTRDLLFAAFVAGCAVLVELGLGWLLLLYGRDRATILPL